MNLAYLNRNYKRPTLPSDLKSEGSFFTQNTKATAHTSIFTHS